jgi:hypothetical protein
MTADELINAMVSFEGREIPAFAADMGGVRLGGLSGLRRGVAGDKCVAPGLCEGRLRLLYGYFL